MNWELVLYVLSMLFAALWGILVGLQASEASWRKSTASGRKEGDGED